MKRTKHVLLVMFMIVMGAASAFAGGGQEALEPASGDQAGSSGTRVVTDYSGRSIEVPAEPTAVIAMSVSATAALVALDITPIGANDRIVGQFIGTEEYLPAGFDPASLPTFGSTYEPDMEMLLALEPDLIIGNEYMEEMFEGLSQIAPTVLVAWPDNGSWQQRFQDTARVVGRPEEAAVVEAEFQEFVAQLPNGLRGATVAFARPAGADFRIDSVPSAFPGSVATEAGIDLLIPEGIDPDAGFADLSGERLGVLAAADFIVVPDFTVAGAAQEDGLTQFESFALWETLPAVQAGRVAQVPGLVYNGGNYFAAKALLDALADLLR